MPSTSRFCDSPERIGSAYGLPVPLSLRDEGRQRRLRRSVTWSCRVRVSRTSSGQRRTSAGNTRSGSSSAAMPVTATSTLKCYSNNLSDEVEEINTRSCLKELYARVRSSEDSCRENTGSAADAWNFSKTLSAAGCISCTSPSNWHSTTG